MVPSEVIVVPIVFGIPAAVVFARMWFKHREKMATLVAPEIGQALEARLAHLEQAVDAIAVELERVGEGQRFVTRLLSERDPRAGRREQPPALRARIDTPL